MDKNRPAVTLLITLSVIASMITLMGMMFGYLDIARKKAEVKGSIIQATILKSDLVRFLHTVIGNSPSSDKMVTLFETPLMISSENGEFSMGVSCSPLQNRVNISWIALAGDANQKKQILAQDIFTMLADKVNLRDTSVLLEKVISSLSSSHQIVFGLQSRINKKKDIISFEKFQQVLDDYYYETGDGGAYNIPWRRYFTFGNKSVHLDGNFLTKELLAFLYNIELEDTQEYKWGELDSFLSDIGENKDGFKWLFSSKTLASVTCSVSYGFRKGNYSFDFNYIDKKIEGFEFVHE